MCCYPYHLVKGLSSIWIILPIKPNILKVDNEDKNASKFLIYIQLIFENSKFLKIFSFSFVGWTKDCLKTLYYISMNFYSENLL